jgi:hypothetical protein
MIVNQITEPPFYLVGVFIHNLYVYPWYSTSSAIEPPTA